MRNLAFTPLMVVDDRLLIVGVASEHVDGQPHLPFKIRRRPPVAGPISVERGR